MKTKLILIAVAAAAFGWGFAFLVEHSDQTIRSENPRATCQEWSGTNCVRVAQR